MSPRSRTTRPEAVTAPHRRLAFKAPQWCPLLASACTYRRSKASRDAPIVGCFIAIAMPNTAEPPRYRHQTP